METRRWWWRKEEEGGTQVGKTLFIRRGKEEERAKGKQPRLPESIPRRAVSPK